MIGISPWFAKPLSEHGTGILLGIGLCLTTLVADDTAAPLVRLANDRVTIDVAPRLGGRMVSMRRPDGENVLAVGRDVLTLPASALPSPTADGPFLPGNGTVVWVGPQSMWWTQQDVNLQRRTARATWPPDPWLEYGSMEMLEQGLDHLHLRGPHSLVTGLRLDLRYHITSDGSVVEAIEAVNASTRTVSWDLWPNTRIRSDARVYVPYQAGVQVRTSFTSWNPGVERELPWKLFDGFLTFDVSLPRGVADHLHFGKLLINALDCHLYAVTPHDLVVAMASNPPPGSVHHEHAPVEVYQCIGGDPARGVLELEFHSGLAVLPPGRTLATAVAWRVVPADGTGTPTDDLRQVRVLESSLAELRAALPP